MPKYLKKIHDTYNRLSDFEKVLVQLCSVIFEPTTKTTLLKCLRETGLQFPGIDIAKASGVLPHLQNLQKLGLLNDRYQCHDDFLETAARLALAEGLRHDQGVHLKQIESETSWNNMPLFDTMCISCGKRIEEDFLKAVGGPVCPGCVCFQTEQIAQREPIDKWPAEQIIDALMPGSGISRRLMVLMRVRDAGTVITNSKHFYFRDFMALIVRNLGFVEPHPLSQIVRNQACLASLALGPQIVPLLIEMFDENPWQYHANILFTAGTLSPSDPKVVRLLKKGAGHPDARIRTSASGKVTVTTDQTNPSRSRPWSNFHRMVNAVDRVLPNYPPVNTESQIKYYYHVVRAFRVGLYTEERHLMDSSIEKYHAAGFHEKHHPDLFVMVCTRPFDRQWLMTLSPLLQGEILQRIIFHSLLFLEPCDAPVAMARDEFYLRALPLKTRVLVEESLATWLLLCGECEEAGKLINRMEKENETRGFKGWFLFVRGQNSAALTAFRQEFEIVEKANDLHGRINIPVLFYLLALVKEHLDPESHSSLEEIDFVLSRVIDRQNINFFTKTAGKAIKAVFSALQYEMEKATALLNELPYGRDNGYPLLVFFTALADLWVNGKISSISVDRISSLFRQSSQVGMNWLSLECAELLCKAEKPTPVRQNFIHRTSRERGMVSFSGLVPLEESWQVGLKALERITRSELLPSREAGRTRLVWLVDVQYHTINIKPKEQRQTKSGNWSKGRPVSLSRLHSGKNLECLTPQDEKIRSTLEKSTEYYGGADYFFNKERLLPCLVGHPLLFHEDAPSVPVEVIKGEPEIIVEETGETITLRLVPDIPVAPVVTQRETPTRIKVYRFSKKQRQIAGVFGRKGLTVPLRAKDSVVASISGLAPLITVFSGLSGDKNTSFEEVVSDARPYIHLMPSGSGFKIDLFVKPLKIGGPYIRPGSGVPNIIIQIDDKRVQAKRDLKKEMENAATVEENCFSAVLVTDSDYQWTAETPEICLNVLCALKPLLDAGEVVMEWPEGEKLKIAGSVSTDNLSLKISSQTDWFEITGQLRVHEGRVLDIKELLEQIRTTGTRFIPMGEGEFVALTDTLRKQLEEMAAITSAKGKAVGFHQTAAVFMEALSEKMTRLESDTEWKTNIKRIRQAKHLVPEIPSTLKTELRNYQAEGFQWLARLAYWGVGACLADDMGLGKTIQALAIILDRAPRGPSLVVAPTSVCMNWISEVTRFAPTLNPVLFGGKKREMVVRELKSYDLLVVSYGLMQIESDLLNSRTWETVILDEAQAIKNISTKRSRAAMELKGHFRMITTGTPIENHLNELYTLFNFINPGLLGSRNGFNKQFAIPIEMDNDWTAKKRLKKLIRPFMLRRLKTHVLEELPPRTEILLQVEPDEEEASFYEALRQAAVEKFDPSHGSQAGRRIKILAAIMKLRRACCHPKLVMPESNISGAKLNLFGKVVRELIENRHKALVFSQFVGHLAIIRDFLDSENIQYRYLDGKTPAKERKNQVDRFQSGDADLFLISLRAGGLGLNLTAASYVIHMDPWWNPAVEDQASDRAHRIGQQHPVTIYRLVTKNTIEEKIVKLHARKRDLADSLLDGSDMSGKMSTDDLLKLIMEK
jgi:superfamily II DNA or RNA helicase